MHHPFFTDRRLTTALNSMQRDAPKLLTASLLLAAALQLYVVWSAHTKAHIDTHASSLSGADLSPAMDRLFGAPHDDHPTASSAGIRLLGTMAFVGDATRGMAIVDIDGRSHLWLVGATLADAQLKEVYPDHIVIERASHAELVAMPKSDGGLGAGRVAAHHVVPTPPPISREAIHHRIAAATAPLAAVLVAEPLMNGDQYSGLIVNPNGNAYAFKQLGLKPGDIIMAVNQRQLNPDTLQFLNEDIRSGRPVRLYVNRPGVGPVDIPINTAAIN